MSMMFGGWGEGDCDWCGKSQPNCDCVTRPVEKREPETYSSTEPRVTKGDIIMKKGDGKTLAWVQRAHGNIILVKYMDLRNDGATMKWEGDYFILQPLYF